MHTTTVPAPSISAEQGKKILEASQAIIRRLDYVGVLCIEFFILKDGSIVANEMAPRPHNSGHYTQNACVTSQFEQQVRAMARLPLGATNQLLPTFMLNILGDEWFSAGDVLSEPAWQKIVANSYAKLHLYGKDEAKRGRKMGHINFIGPSAQDVLQACLQTEALLSIKR